jgi:hypothetical protein
VADCIARVDTLKTDWLGTEDNLVSILRDTTISDHEKIALCKQVIDTFTQRGHFDPNEYCAPHSRVGEAMTVPAQHGAHKGLCYS